jgi:hypothetical protein
MIEKLLRDARVLEMKGFSGHGYFISAVCGTEAERRSIPFPCPQSDPPQRPSFLL